MQVLVVSEMVMRVAKEANMLVSKEVTMLVAKEVGEERSGRRMVEGKRLRSPGSAIVSFSGNCLRHKLSERNTFWSLVVMLIKITMAVEFYDFFVLFQGILSMHNNLLCIH